MSGFHWTRLEFGALAFTVAVLAGLAWMQWEKRRDDREIALSNARLAEQERQFADDVECFCMQAAGDARPSIEPAAGLVEPGDSDD